MKTLTFIIVLLLSGCAAGNVRVIRPDGVTIEASAFALFRDTGLENFSYSTDEASKGSGLLPSTEKRTSQVGAQGYRGATNIDSVIRLLEAVK